jgi:hypothetical protein
VLYVALACTFLPTLITVLVQKHLSPVTVSFIYILEPVLGAIIAMIYLHELLPIQGYTGGLLVVVGAIIHTWGTAFIRQPSTEQSASDIEERSAAFWQPEVLAGSTPAWNVQSHLQVGGVPYSVSRKGEKTLVQRRRHDRLQRISHQGMKLTLEQAQKISATPVDANVSCALPVYWPSVPSQYPPLSINDHTILSNTYIEATEMRSR